MDFVLVYIKCFEIYLFDSQRHVNWNYWYLNPKAEISNTNNSNILLQMFDPLFFYIKTRKIVFQTYSTLNSKFLQLNLKIVEKVGIHILFLIHIWLVVQNNFTVVILRAYGWLSKGWVLWGLNSVNNMYIIS